MELDRPDIIATIKHRQYNFFKKLLSLRIDEAVSRKIVSLHRNLPICAHYDGLDPNVIEQNKLKRYQGSCNATTTYLSRYHKLINKKYNHVIYDSCISENIRIVITRWRLSCHSLRVETGRYEVPFLARHLRICLNCGVLEDETHAIFSCNIYDEIRQRYADYLKRYSSISIVFNPGTTSDAVILGNYLLQIENKREELGLN